VSDHGAAEIHDNTKSPTRVRYPRRRWRKPEAETARRVRPTCS
jgi:hypothetical protein